MLLSKLFLATFCNLQASWFASQVKSWLVFRSAIHLSVASERGFPLPKLPTPPGA